MPPTFEEAQQAIDNFVAAETKQISDVLLFAIKQIARTGLVCYKWGSLVHLLVHRLKEVLETPSENFPIASTGLAGEASYEDSCQRLYVVLLAFPGPPFTVQRLCELLTNPHGHHKTKHKLLAAVDKLLSVTSVVPETPISEMPELTDADVQAPPPPGAPTEGAAGSSNPLIARVTAHVCAQGQGLTGGEAAGSGGQQSGGDAVMMGEGGTGGGAGGGGEAAAGPVEGGGEAGAETEQAAASLPGGGGGGGGDAMMTEEGGGGGESEAAPAAAPAGAAGEGEGGGERMEVEESAGGGPAAEGGGAGT